MTIVCGTDFSQHSAEVEAVAALIAERRCTDLALVRVASAELSPPVTPPVLEPAELLAARANRLATQHRIQVSSRILEGTTAEPLLAFALAARAQLVIVSAFGAREDQGFPAVNVAEQIVQQSTVPVLVVRDAERIRAWLQGERTLRVMLGVDLGASSRAPLAWLRELRKLAPCDVQVVQVVWPALEHSRLGIPGPIALEGMNSDLDALLQRDLRAWVGTLEGQGELSFVVSPSWGRCDSQLLSLAADSKVDLLVVGTHQKSWAARIWQGSVSRAALRDSATNVACVPRSTADDRGTSAVRFRRVLIATDFSELANHALAAGYGLLRSDGEAHLVYVRSPEDRETAASELEARLLSLIPEGVGSREIVTRVHVLSDSEPHAGIVRLAERLAVDAICLSTHGRSGLSELVLGSQAQAVLRLAKQPVLLVKAGPE